MYVLLHETYPNADYATYGGCTVVLGIFDSIENMKKHKIDHDPLNQQYWFYYELEINKLYSDLNYIHLKL